MTLDPDVESLLAAQADAPPLETLTLDESRAAIRRVAALQGDAAEAVSVRDIEAPSAGEPVGVRLYSPDGVAAPAPVVVWAHAGGWTRGDLDTWDTPLKNLAHRLEAVVASVDYRLAPESRFPAPVDDMLAVLAHLASSADRLGVDLSRVVVGGDSAGGNLAAAAALAVRDLAVGVPLAAQVLLYPPLEPSCATESALRYATGYALTRAAMQQAWHEYLPTAFAGSHPYAAPLRARILAGLPFTVIATAEYDPARDDGEHYASRLAADGVDVVARRFPGMIHGFFHHNGAVPASTALPEWLAERLRPVLHG
ncbi:acetyl esterase [Haloactinopolyspora alba]|uniref:Acetyl esterase n=1 Tax=Haloactinopolyspora alba TaxID=648780 RepID=A0A2P8EFF5_9ACTN|nr:alpha/beta hydrolase [Haloactinopolyspora alba]PSL08195.1 acetyl esterase [Haloactinopolyspora alba]